MSGTKPNHSPAGPVLASFLVGLLITGLSLAGAAAWMEHQGISNAAAWPLSTAAVCLGSFAGGWLAAFLQKSRGLICGAVEGWLIIGLLLALLFGYGGTLNEMQGLRCALVLCAGCLGGFCGMLCTEKLRH